MTIHHQVLGTPGRDNALLVRIDTGQSLIRLLFDCGEGCLSDLSLSEVRSVDHLFFSHLHMDHVGGFDSFFRSTYNRDAKPNVVWGPPETATVLHHRFRGFWWNLHEGQPGTWQVRDVHEDGVRSWRFETAEAFRTRHDEAAPARGKHLVDDDAFTVDVLHLDHRGPCLSYLVREKPRRNVDTARLAALGLQPGPWIRRLKRKRDKDSQVEIDGRAYDLRELRRQLLVDTPGESVAYLTDFLLNEAAEERLAAWLAGCDTVVCEAQYRHSDLELARRNFHTTTRQVGELARRAEISRLILFHLSERYDDEEWRAMLAECRQVFPHTAFPESWEL